MKNIKKQLLLSFLLLLNIGVEAQVKTTRSKGHSHNDYRQSIPFLRAYYAGMESIEADVFLMNDTLYVAHELSEIRMGRTLDSLYIRPLVALFKENNGHPFADTNKHLQLVIDIKEDHQNVIPAIVKSLEPYLPVFDRSLNPHAVQIVLSGEMPAPDDFDLYPIYLHFDGRPNISYGEQLNRIAMISQDIKQYSLWNGKGTPTPQDKLKLQAVVEEAQALGKPFRFWATSDNPNAVLELEKLGVDWINTDHPEDLQRYYNDFERSSYTNAVAYPVYYPTFAVDETNNKVNNVILLIGDGMGLAQIKAGLSANYGKLSLTQIRNIGFSLTEAMNADNTDSAAGGTALATGQKTNNRYVGTDTNSRALLTLPLIARQHGIESALLSTGDATDATPASFYAAQPEREWSEKIAYDFLMRPSSILLGGAPKWYKDQGKRYAFESQLKKQGFLLNYTLADFQSSNVLKQVVLLPDSAIRPVKAGRGLLLQQALQKSISIFTEHKRPFFIMAEGAQIDYGGHAKDLPYVVTEMLDFDQAVAAALKFADEDKHTLVIITADHETGGLSLLDADRKNGYVRGHFSTNDHTNIAVPVFAYGPGSQHFRGFYENTAVFDKIMELMVGEKKASQKKNY